MSLLTKDIGLTTGFDFTESTEPTSELVTIADIEARQNLALDDDQSVTINDQIKAIRSQLERKLNMSLVSSKTITAYWRSVSSMLLLPFPPVTSITSVSTVDLSDGTETSLTSGTDYWVEGVKNKSIRFMSSWSGYGMKIVYVTGMTNTADLALVKDAMLSEVMEWFNNKSNPDETQYVLGRSAMIKLAHLRPV